MSKKVRGDKNLVQQQADSSNLTWFDPKDGACSVEGLPWFKENQDYGRLPKQIRPTLRETLDWVAMQPSGVAFRFRSNSNRLAIDCRFMRKERFRSNPLLSESGFDVYIGRGKQQRFLTNLSIEEARLKMDAACALPAGEHDICIYAPILNPIKSITFGIEATASLKPVRALAHKPILFYGSSITQGFCCSRPGLTYPAQVCRHLGAGLINMGFGGNARGDKVVAQQFAQLAQAGHISAFVYDYDHNSRNLQELRKTHEAFFKIIRKAAPRLPILILSSPNHYKNPEFFQKRFEVIQRTYQRAKDAGDKHVQLLPGKRFYASLNHVSDCTVDNLHPNDIGFSRMAELVSKKLSKVL